jgi:hypothetical protein
LGIRGNAVIFSLISTILLRPLPIRHPVQVFAIHQGKEKDVSYWQSMSYPNYKPTEAPAAANPFAIPAPMPLEAPVTSATLPSKTHILFPPRLCSIVVKTLRAAPAMLAPLCWPVLILSMLGESRLIVVTLNQYRTAINDNRLPSSESFLHQE